MTKKYAEVFGENAILDFAKKVDWVMKYADASNIDICNGCGEKLVVLSWEVNVMDEAVEGEPLD